MGYGGGDWFLLGVPEIQEGGHTKTEKELKSQDFSSFCDPGEARTHDPMIKSHLLYQLSHGVIDWGVGVSPFASAKLDTIFEVCK